MGCVTTRLGDPMNASARPERAHSAKQALLSILISIALACSFAPSAFAADYDDLFNDPGFAQAFYSEYGETNGGVPWTEADLEAMTRLYFSYQSIGSLDDLRLFPNITELTIAYTPMTSIEADTFQNNPSLEGIGFYGNNIATIDENAFAAALYTHDLPDVDLLIRTSGEMRLSNFLLYQCAYAEMEFPAVLWPDFSLADYHAALEAFAARDRRFGGRKQ